MACERCHDTYWVSSVIDGVERVRRCDCWRAAMAQRQIVSAGIPDRYAHCELSNFEQTVDSLREAHRKARKFIDDFPSVEKGLLLRGPTGVGKTHLAVAILKQVVREKRARAHFYETPKFLRLVRETYSGGTNETEMEVLRPLLEAELLVLDDLGAERTSEWVQETLGIVVNARYNGNLPTIFTTNLNTSENDEDLNSIGFQLGKRIRSRLFEMCHDVLMEGQDVREHGVHVTPETAAKALRDSGKGVRRPGGFPEKSRAMARAGLKAQGPADLAWSGGKGGSR
jgi:DNA replication protein DnaC